MMSRKDFERVINDTERFQKLNGMMKEISEDTKELTKDEFMEFLDQTTKEEAIRTIVKMIIIGAIAMATTKWVFLAFIYILIKAFLYDLQSKGNRVPVQCNRVSERGRGESCGAPLRKYIEFREMEAL